MLAELVCGPPGSGKTTYCEGKRQFLTVYDPARPVILFNLDPANEDIFPYPCDINICELIKQNDVMNKEGLGPNGSYLYCAELIADNMDWIECEIKRYVKLKIEDIRNNMYSFSVTSQLDESNNNSSNNHFGTNKVGLPYLIIDCPGQVEFYLYSQVIHNLIKLLQKKMQCNVCALHLTDATVAIRSVPTYISTCLLSLSCLVDFELPHINVLTKWDAIPDFDTMSKSMWNQNNKNRNIKNFDVIEDLDTTDDELLMKTDLAIGDTKELFLEPGEFFRSHMNRIWKLTNSQIYCNQYGPIANITTETGFKNPIDFSANKEVVKNIKNKEENITKNNFTNKENVNNIITKDDIATLVEKNEKNDIISPENQCYEIVEISDNVKKLEINEKNKKEKFTKDKKNEKNECKCPVSTLSTSFNKIKKVHYSDTPLFRMSNAIMDVIEGYGLVSFVPLDVESQDLMLKLTQKIDYSIGKF